MLDPVSEVRNFAHGFNHSEGGAVGQDAKVYAGGQAGQVHYACPDKKKSALVI